MLETNQYNKLTARKLFTMIEKNQKDMTKIQNEVSRLNEKINEKKKANAAMNAELQRKLAAQQDESNFINQPQEN